MQLSIIVPVYNVETYLPRCIDSILAQTLASFELILVDDGSPDRCGAIIEEYARKDPRIVAIHQKNKGVSAARNAGLRIAKGEYVGFVDPDDYISPEMFGYIIKGMKRVDAEIGCCSFAICDEEHRVQHRNVQLPEIMGKDEFYRQLFCSPRTVYGSVWNKVFLREVIITEFQEGVSIAEDWLFLCQNHKKVNNIYYTVKELYFYFDRDNSATRQDILALVSTLPVRLKMLQIAESISSLVAFQAEADYLDSCVLYMMYAKQRKASGQYRSIRRDLVNYVYSHIGRILCNNAITVKFKLRLCLVLWFG